MDKKKKVIVIGNKNDFRLKKVVADFINSNYEVITINKQSKLKNDVNNINKHSFSEYKKILK
jgi:hypothetical protein